MYQAEHCEWIRWSPRVVAVAIAALAWNGCGKTSAEGGSGETHFLAYCDEVCGDGLVCLCGVCTRACSVNTDCSAVGSADATCTTSSCGTQKLCDVQCTSNAECSAVGASYECKEGRCRAGFGGDGGTKLCTSSDGTPISCDFAECASPPASTCSIEDTCTYLDCGGLEFDENGCRRASCDNDADCGAGERCTMITCADTTSCASAEDGTCQCETDFICVADSRCNPESIAGPRGDFQSLEIVQGAGPCPPGETCIWSWTFTPEGHVEYSKNGVAGSADLTETDLATLLSTVNGVDLRLAMRDGITCDPPPTDVGVTFRLTLSTQTLERDATGCAISGPDGNVFDVLFELTTRY